jgi:hypothetical protein
MKHGKPGIPVLLAGFILGLALGSIFASQPRQQSDPKKEPKKTEKSFIPLEVKTVFEQGISTRQPRLDIPFSIFKHIYLPAKDSIHNIFFFKAKNADLGFAPTAQPSPSQLQARFPVFLQFLHVEKASPPKIVREAYVPVTLQADSESYDPEKEAWY